MRILLPDLHARKRVMRELAIRHPAWKRKLLFCLFLLLVGFVIIALTVKLMVTQTPRAIGYLVFGVPGLTVAIIPIIYGVIRYVSAKHECALPYSSYGNGTITMFQDRLEFTYWEIRKETPEATEEGHMIDYPDNDRTIFSIDKDKIRDVSTEDGLICTISGSGKVKIPDWKRDGDQFFLDKIQYVSEFSFPLAFAEADVVQIINNWRRS
ncbi:MAG TPA: hypothetical protein GX734_00720 [Clostridiaceae bacterium]|nr:hypothetical protein [Clostridiaceae bacterium]